MDLEVMGKLYRLTLTDGIQYIGRIRYQGFLGDAVDQLEYLVFQPFLSQTTLSVELIHVSALVELDYSWADFEVAWRELDQQGEYAHDVTWAPNDLQQFIGKTVLIRFNWKSYRLVYVDGIETGRSIYDNQLGVIPLTGPRKGALIGIWISKINVIEAIDLDDELFNPSIVQQIHLDRFQENLQIYAGHSCKITDKTNNHYIGDVNVGSRYNHVPPLATLIVRQSNDESVWIDESDISQIEILTGEAQQKFQSEKLYWQTIAEKERAPKERSDKECVTKPAGNVNRTVHAENPIALTQDEFVDELQGSVISFSYIKMNGDFREATGTLNADYIKRVSEVQHRNLDDSDLVLYFDLDKDAYRMFHWDKLAEITQIEDIEDYLDERDA